MFSDKEILFSIWNCNSLEISGEPITLIGECLISDKTFLITGVANQKSVATFVGKTLLQAGAKIVLLVQNDDNESKAKKIFPEQEIIICNALNFFLSYFHFTTIIRFQLQRDDIGWKLVSIATTQ